MHHDTPIIIEFAGLPAAGKTTAVNLLRDSFLARGVSYKVIPTALNVSPLAHFKKEWTFDAWSICRTIMYLLEESIDSKNDIVIIQRGLLDSLCWLEWFRANGKIEPVLAQKIEEFVKIPQWFQKTSLTIALLADFKTGLQRRGKIGKIVNPETYTQLRAAYDTTLNSLRTIKSNNIVVIETDTLSPSQVHNLIIERLRTLNIVLDLK